MKRGRMERILDKAEYAELLERVTIREDHQCFFAEHVPHDCSGIPQACHLIGQSQLRSKFPRGAVLRTVKVYGDDPDDGYAVRTLYLPIGRVERITADDDVLTLKQIAKDHRNAVLGCEFIHNAFDRRVLHADPFEIPRDVLPIGFEPFVNELGLAGEASKRFPYATSDELTAAQTTHTESELV